MTRWLGEQTWEAIYEGYSSAVDWPTAGFFRELYAAYPTARFILTVRDPERWVESFSHTIYKLLAGREVVPTEMLGWFDMAKAVINRTGFRGGLDAVGLASAFEAHNQTVKSVIPSSQLLEFDVEQGWRPLCDFLGRAVPAEPFPRTNDRAEFWDRVAGKI